MTLPDLIGQAVDRPLTAEEAEFAFTRVMEGEATPVQVSALLVAIRARGAVAAEIAGGVRALRSAMVPVVVPGDHVLIDTCGTGGGALTTFNISTAAALLVAGLGVRVAKHGNRSFTSRCGSADVLEALGVHLEATPERKAEILEAANIVFLFAPAHHPAMRHVGPVRKELGMFTIMNLLGPLTNPAGVRRQVVGVSDPRLLELVAGGLAELGHEHGMVVHGEPGLDELSPLGVSRIIEVQRGAEVVYDFDPQEALGWPTFDAAELRGGDPADNAAIIAAVLKGDGARAASAAVALNAAAALVVAGEAHDLAAGVEMAERGLRDAVGWRQLEKLREETGGG